MKRVVVVVLFFAIVISASVSEDKYVPLTMEQAKTYITIAGPDEIAREIIAFDWIQHTNPVAEVPPSLIAIHGSDAAIAWQAPLKFSIPALPGATIPMPVWSVELKDQKYPGVVPSASRDGYIYAGLIGVALGVTAVLILKR